MEFTISLPDGDQRLAMTGSAERNLKIIREAFGVHVTARDGLLRFNGNSRAVRQAVHVVERLAEAAKSQDTISRREVLDLVASVARRAGEGEMDDRAASSWEPGEPGGPGGQQIELYRPGRSVHAITPGQRQYLAAIHTHDLTLCTGPAGTGKTYLAVAAAVDLLKRGQVRRLILVRPAVEAGEKLGFLPGSMREKVDPYLRPLMDALHDMMEFEHIQRFLACDLIEVVPLAFMRGRTLNDAMIILDEAQNTTRSQMLMFLTRMGHGGKMVVTGDTSQIDLEEPRQSGLVDAVWRLKRVKGVGLVSLDQADIVRHSLVQRIVEAYHQDKPLPVNNLMDDGEGGGWAGPDNHGPDPPSRPTIMKGSADTKKSETNPKK